MVTFDEFIRALKARVRKTQPSPAGLWSRYLDESCSDLDAFVVNLCYSLLQGDEGKKKDYSSLRADDDALWYVQRFIEEQASRVKGKSDNEPLVLGLAAVVMIAPKSDPRDVIGWIDRLYYAARNAGVPEPHVYFERLAGLLADQSEFLAQRMRNYPALIESHEFEMAKRPR